MRAIQAIRLLCFVALLTLPLLAMRRHAGGALESEKRQERAMPRLASAGARFPEQFDAFFADHFGFRERLIRWHHILKIKWLRESPVPNVIVGSDGWLFYAGYRDGADIGDFAGRSPYRAAQLDQWLQHQEQRRAGYAKRGIRYLIAIVPNKQTIWPERVPLRFGPPAPGTLDALLARAPAHAELELLDLRPPLQAHRGEPLFYRTDTHWNANGAFFAAQAVVERLRARLPNLATLRREDYEVVSAPSRAAGDLARMLALPAAFFDEEISYRRRDGLDATVVDSDGIHALWQRPAVAQPRLLVLGDSFGREVGERLADVFARTYYQYSARTGYDEAVVLREHPDVVVLVLVERYLYFLDTL